VKTIHAEFNEECETHCDCERMSFSLPNETQGRNSGPEYARKSSRAAEQEHSMRRIAKPEQERHQWLAHFP
jgi:hypothetical protein